MTNYDEIDFSPLHEALARLHTEAAAYDTTLNRLLADDGVEPSRARPLNAVLMTAERALTREGGLPMRSWYRHQVYAPGLYTGYGVKTLPGAREAIEQRDWDGAHVQIRTAAAALSRMADVIAQASRLLHD